MISQNRMQDILIIEPFCGGSHGQLVGLLIADEEISTRARLCSLPAKKWHWRARTSALYLSQVIPKSEDYRILFTSSVLNLAELVALRPDLARLKKILYFHENQLVYPVRKHQDRDFQYGYNQILSCIVADSVIFNSAFNMESFLSSIPSFLKLIPDFRPKNLECDVRPKCKVLYFPMKIDVSQISSSETKRSNTTTDSKLQLPNDFNQETDNLSNPTRNHTVTTNSISQLSATDHKILDEPVIQLNSSHTENNVDHEKSNSHPSHSINQEQSRTTSSQQSCFMKWDPTKVKPGCLHIVWPHRWEHDKDPESFFSALFELQKEGLDFLVSVVGETYSQVPEVFTTAREQLGERVCAWGYQSRSDYLAVLEAAHVVISTAQHEFFGVSMLEAVSKNCYPLCPNRLVYPEIYPKECLYSTHNQLVKMLRKFCRKPQYVDYTICKNLPEKFSWTRLQGYFRNLFLS